MVGQQKDVVVLPSAGEPFTSPGGAAVDRATAALPGQALDTRENSIVLPIEGHRNCACVTKPPRDLKDVARKVG